MLALYRAGRQADALDAYRRARAVLVDELGIEPAAELRDLEQAILTQSPELEPATAGSQPSPALAATLRLESERPLFGRDREREQLAASWQTVVSGDRRFVLVDGEAGIGKTRLAADVARLVHDAGHTVLYGACDEALAVPGRPLVEALRPYIAACDTTTVRDLVGPYGGDLARLLPEIGVRLPGVTSSPSGDLEVAQMRLLDALVHLLAAGGSSAPLLLVVDDLHWADELTLLALRHLARAEQAPSVLIVGTFRPSEPWRSRLLTQLVAEAARRRDVVRLELGPLTAADVSALMGDAGVEDASSVLEVHAATDGNPFFLVEMLHALSEGRGDERTRVPTGVRDVLRARLARMPEGASRVVATAALIGREFDVSLLLELGDDDEVVLGALELAERAQLVRPVPGVAGRFAFRHALVVDALADDLPAAKRLHVHERIATRLAARQRSQPSPAALLAHHFMCALPLGHAAEAERWASAAGDEATANLAFESAAAHYADALKALRLAGTPDGRRELELRVEHGRALRRAGDLEAFAVLFETARAAGDAGEVHLMAEALLAAKPYSSGVAPDPELAALLRRALEQLPEQEGPTRARLLGFLAMEGMHAVGGESERLVGESLAMARRSGNPAAIVGALMAYGWVARHPATVLERLELARELVDISRPHRLAFHECMGHMFQYMAHVERGDRPAAAAALSAAAETPGQSTGKWVIAYYRASWTLLQGQLEQAEQEAHHALAVGREAGIGEPVLRSGFSGQLACIRMLQGRIAELESPLIQIATVQPLSPAWQAFLAKLHCDQDRLPEARTALRTALDSPAARFPRHFQWSTTMVLLADVAAALGERAECEALLGLLVPFQQLMTWNITSSVGPFDLALGRLAAALGRRSDAESYLRAAAALCERVGAEAFLAIARHELAAMLDDGLEKRQLAGSARAAADRLGLALPVTPASNAGADVPG